MLNQDALAQLRQLKQQIQDDKVQTSGVVRGTQGRYGFAVLDDGREIYLSAEQMQRVFPDDRIEIEIITNDDGKPSAQLEKLVSSELREFTGQYVVRDNAHFVEPDLPRLSRWIFVPPKMRMNAQHGDYVCARITRHPFSDGKAQAKIEKIIGGAKQPMIHARYALARYGLPNEPLTLAEIDVQTPDFNERRDLTALPLVTIDGAETRDMDDALYAEARPDGGWQLTVAIADPSAWIKPDSTLEQAIAQRATSIYLPGMTVAMLPEQLANERCSLQPDVDRLALICELTIDSDGRVTQYAFSEARVRSCAKLSYDNVNRFLGDAEPVVAPWTQSVTALRELALRLQNRRQLDNIVLPERGEYRALLDANRVVERYIRQEKTPAHQLVEECMIATNRCAADFLSADRAIFIGHRGFRSERRDPVGKLLSDHLPDTTFDDATKLPGYIGLMQRLASQQHELPLREILFRSLERSQFVVSAEPHFGMGLAAYTTITSPIRKYNDFLMHRFIKAKLRQASLPALTDDALAQIQEGSDRARQASNLAQQWLDCDYLQRNYLQRTYVQQSAAEPQQSTNFQAEIVHVTSSGLVVRLVDNGIQGFIDLRRSNEKFSFDNVYMKLSSPSQSFQLEQHIDVNLAGVDMKKRAISFALVASSAAGRNEDVASESATDDKVTNAHQMMHEATSAPPNT